MARLACLCLAAFLLIPSPALGQAPTGTVTVGDRFVGGTTQGLSQESVQEFQVSTINFDPSTGVTGAGAINIVTRSGTNQLHGSGFLYFRDHHLAAYPGLRRDPRQPEVPFAQRQGGGSAGGPVIRDRVYWFANYERNNQDAVFAVSNNHPIFSKFDGIFANPLDGHQFNVRVDGRVNDNQHAFVRYSLDRNRTVTPAGSVGLPSNWQNIRNIAEQAQAGLTSVLTPSLVNDLRVSFTQLDGAIDTIRASDCGDPVPCVVMVADDGRGFNLTKAREQGGGLGLQSMDERVRLVGGRLSIETAPQSGTTITVWAKILVSPLPEFAEV